MFRTLHHRPAAVAAALLLALAGCAAPVTTPRPAEPPLSYPPTVRERMLRIALGEWEEWGRLVLTLAPGLAPHQALEDATAPGPESLLANFPRVLAYWRAVEDGEAQGAVARNRARYATAAAHPDAPGGAWREPAWSAAFISYVMLRAGVDRREFPSSAAHSFYIDGMLADAAAFPAVAPFVPQDWAAYTPQPGDLVCADRSRHPIADWRQRLAETGQFRPMHCDIVVSLTPGFVEAVGGNVADAVTLSRFPADAAGRLLPRPGNGAIWFAVFENRLGRLPPWNLAAMQWSAR
ncbi:DUF2272 domain-containing protein [Pseudoroseomonas globiformis]|uniref:DUF2272 domain-containing protein n=1 Tax=Teichococcus globiformis TaxID=2307229 RepID=A0ABV7G3F3_9PROT